MQHFLIRLWHAMKSGFSMTTDNNQLRGWTENLQSTAQNQTCTPSKKVMVTVWCSAAHLIHYSFLNPDKTIAAEKYAQQFYEMHRKLQCLQMALVNRKGPVLLRDSAWLHVTQPMLQKLNELEYEVLPHPPYSPDLLPSNSCFKHIDNFLQGKRFHNQQKAENTSLSNLKAWIFTLQE